GDRNHAGFGDREIGSGNSDVGRDVLVAQNPPRDHHQFLRIVSWFRAKLLLEQLADLSSHQMHRGKDEMIRSLVPELNDVLSKITFHDAEPCLLEGFVEMDLLAGHHLGLDDGARVLLANDAKDYLTGLLTGAGPMHVRSARLEFVRKFFEVGVEMIDRIPLNLGGGLSR